MGLFRPLLPGPSVLLPQVDLECLGTGTNENDRMWTQHWTSIRGREKSKEIHSSGISHPAFECKEGN